ncbi:MAG: glycosyltransferase family 2 protein, partial [Clostridiales bacterium]|nr:glycosyltransferase family 2 protein [Clostridiales bacterium]
MPKISVIMPVYNSEQFLRMAVDSVLNQTFEDFELIMVDDGSKDQSGAICDEYAQKDARVKVIHQENGGICAARNTGMKAAEGEYLAFIDNDDEYLPNLLEENYALAQEYDADVVKYGYRVEETFKDGFVDHRKQVV